VKYDNKRGKKLIICRCMEVTDEDIRDAIRLLLDIDSSSLIDQVKKLTSAGMGLCQSRTCQHLIERIIREETGKSPIDYPPIKPRPPTKPIKIDVLRDMAL
jgi:bacterioferritin-associated ferredoxin